MRLATRLSSLLVALVLVSACSDGRGLFEPLGYGLHVPVTLDAHADVSSGNVARLEITGGPAGAVATWDVTSGPCLDADASALQSGDVVEIRIHRSANALALCVNEPVTYHYVARVTLPPGRYEVRLVDDLLGQALRPIGRGTVEVAGSIL
jgi:hypothetical protein